MIADSGAILEATFEQVGTETDGQGFCLAPTKLFLRVSTPTRQNDEELEREARDLINHHARIVVKLQENCGFGVLYNPYVSAGDVRCHVGQLERT